MNERPILSVIKSCDFYGGFEDQMKWQESTQQRVQQFLITIVGGAFSHLKTNHSVYYTPWSLGSLLTFSLEPLLLYPLHMKGLRLEREASLVSAQAAKQGSEFMSKP